MEYSSLQNSELNIRVECDRFVHLDNVIDLYENQRELVYATNYMQKAFLKKDFKKDLKKWKRSVDYGDYIVSEDYLLLKQFYDYNVRFMYWNDEEEYEKIKVSMRIGMPNKKSEKLENFMREWSHRILNQPLFTIAVDKEKTKMEQIGPFEFTFEWDVKEKIDFEFTFKTMFISDQFENFLGHRTFFIFEFFAGKDFQTNIGQLAYKFFSSKKENRTVLMKRFVNPVIKPSMGLPTRGIHLQNANRKTKAMLSHDMTFLKLNTSTRFGLFMVKMNHKKVLHYATNGDVIFGLDFDKDHLMRIERPNFFDPMYACPIRIVINLEIGYEESDKKKFKRDAFSVNYDKCVFPGCMLETLVSHQSFSVTCEYPKYLDQDEFLVLALKFSRKAFEDVGLDKSVVMLTVAFYRDNSDMPIDQHYSWVSFVTSPNKKEIDDLNKHVVKSQKQESSKPLVPGLFNTLSCFTIYGIFFLKITEMNVSVPIYVYSNNSKAFCDAIVAAYNDLYNKKIGKLLSFVIEDHQVYTDEIGVYRALAIPNKTFFEFTCSEDLTHGVEIINNEPVKYSGYNIYVVVDYANVTGSPQHNLLFKSVKP